MESTKRSEIKVGLFALTGVILFCVSIILLGGDKWILKRTYALKVMLPQVQGLAKGSVVSLSGVPIGNVTELDFKADSNEVEVTVKIDQGAQARITKGSMATIKTQGALGDKYIFIQPGPFGAPALQEGEMLETDRSPDFLDIMAAKGAEFGEVVNVIKEMRILLEGINKDGDGRHLISNLASAAYEARETLKIVRTETLVPLNSVMRKLDAGQGTLGALINDPSLHNRLLGIVGSNQRNQFLKPLIRESIQTYEKKTSKP